MNVRLVGKQIVARANQSRFDYKHLKEVFGFDDGVSTQAEMLDLIFAETAEAAQIREKLYQALAIKHYEFNAQGVELNQRYVSNAMLAETTTENVFTRPAIVLASHYTPRCKKSHIRG